MNNGKLILAGELQLLSPLHIGSGENDSTDLDVIKDSNGKPFITFTSFIGALRHHLKKNYPIDDNELNQLFGYSEDENSRGSIIMGSDLFLTYEPKSLLLTRDGIKIDVKTGIVADKAKYDYQIIDRGAKLSFKLESAYQSDFISKDTLLRYYATIIEMLKDNNSDCQPAGLRIGAKTNNGLGKIQLINEKLFDFDFEKSENVIAWLLGTNPKPMDKLDAEPFTRKKNDLIIEAYLDLKTSLIQRSYNDEPSMPDASHIQSQGEDVLAGSGAKGAITARARKIVNTIWDEKDEENKTVFLDNLLGYVHDKNDKLDKRKDKTPRIGKLQIEERTLPAYIAEMQARIKIDRFTGGTVSGALFDSMPLFNTKELESETDINKKYTRITLRVKDCSEAEAGLMLLVLKDLWTGDLAIGGEKGIGRGVFNGVSASIKYQGKEVIQLAQKPVNLSDLKIYVDALVKETGGVK